MLNDNNSRKRVSFSPALNSVSASVSPLEVPAKFSDEIVRHEDLWYSEADLRDMRDQARQLSMMLRQHSNSEETMAESRGLEQRSCIERQRRKFIAIKCIVRYASSQKQLEVTPVQLANYAHRFTHWAQVLAHKTAVLDSLAVSGSTRIGTPDESFSSPEEQQFSRKRSLAQIDNRGLDADRHQHIRSRQQQLEQ